MRHPLLVPPRPTVNPVFLSAAPAAPLPPSRAQLKPKIPIGAFGILRPPLPPAGLPGHPTVGPPVVLVPLASLAMAVPHLMAMAPLIRPVLANADLGPGVEALKKLRVATHPSRLTAKAPDAVLKLAIAQLPLVASIRLLIPMARALGPQDSGVPVLNALDMANRQFRIPHFMQPGTVAATAQEVLRLVVMARLVMAPSIDVARPPTVTWLADIRPLPTASGALVRTGSDSSSVLAVVRLMTSYRFGSANANAVAALPTIGAKVSPVRGVSVLVRLWAALLLSYGSVLDRLSPGLPRRRV